MPLLRPLYAGAVLGARLASLAAPSGSKLGRGGRGRKASGERLRAWAARHRDPARPLVWIHAPSVGEGLQARAVLAALRSARPDLQAVFTHFSPSAEALAASMVGAEADAAGYLPWDLARPCRRMLGALRPQALVFTKTEVWPVLAGAARAAGVPTLLVAGTLPEGAGRLGWPARALLRPAFAGLARVCAISADDAERFARLGVSEARVEVTGDPGVDSAGERVDAADPDAPYLAPFRDGGAPWWVAGSTWPADEAVVVDAAGAVRGRGLPLRLLVAPHEPTPDAVRALRSRLRVAGWRSTTLGEVEKGGAVGEADAVVVDRVGVLAHLYTVGALAHVGGGFGRAGLHSVLEPAAAGVPVLFGPHHRSARAAGELVGAGAGFVVRDAGDAARRVETLLADAGRRAAAGAAARRYIDVHRGAARRTAERVALYLQSPTAEFGSRPR